MKIEGAKGSIEPSHMVVEGRLYVQLAVARYVDGPPSLCVQKSPSQR